MKLEPSCKGFCNCYFCEMLKHQKNTPFLLCTFIAILVSSCEGMFNKEEKRNLWQGWTILFCTKRTLLP